MPNPDLVYAPQAPPGELAPDPEAGALSET
jgi:hypothetical protein